MWIGISGEFLRSFIIGILILFLFLVFCGKLEENYKKYKNNFEGFSTLRGVIFMTFSDLLPVIVVLFTAIIWYKFH